MPLTLLTVCLLAPAAEAPPVTFVKRDGQLNVAVGGKPFATYVWKDPKISRPYFRDVHVPGGPQVTRTHPPVAGKDLDDHPTFHPGVWMAFGDLGGHDSWRNRARVRHVRFTREPKTEEGRGSFAVVNEYLSGDGKAVICREACSLRVLPRAGGVLLLWDSRFTAESAAFGDQEEMGLGVRIASPLAVKRGGRILNSDGKRNEAQVWGKPAAWCDYAGRLDGQWVGVTILTHADNFRPSWFHARDYGLLLANPFGRNAFTRGPKSRVDVTAATPLRLRYGLFVHGGAEENVEALKAAYEAYGKLTREEGPKKR